MPMVADGCRPIARSPDSRIPRPVSGFPDPALEPLAAALRARHPVAPGLLRGNAA
ncbi:hypothetical protein [Streptomyces sp. NPDC088812]|uniref:hypothetical protein n=1 Tax=Streptomyces sp. NPDC088812 TaxID=3365905 RepID=UPI003820DA5D